MKQTSEQRSKLYGVFASALGVLSLLASASCAEDRDRAGEAAAPVGTLGLGLLLDPNVVLDTIDYEITGVGFTRTGSLAVPGTGTTFSATITEIPVGQGYRLRLTSRALGDAGIACAGEAVFDVAQSATTQVTVTLLCDALDTSGAASINGAFNVCPAVTSTTLTPTVQTVGGSIALGVTARDIDRAPSALSYAWSAASGSFTNATSQNPSFTCTAAGPVSIQYTVTDGSCSRGGVLSVTCSAAADGGASGGADGGLDGGGPLDAGPTSAIVINEVESNGGTPGDWVELYNGSAAPVDVSGWAVKDNDDTRTFAIASGTVIPAGGYLVVEEAQFGYGLGGGDAARLYLADRTTLVDSYVWTAHATETYGRCPNGLGALVQTRSTKGVVNDCSPPDAGVDAGSSGDGGAVVLPTVVINEVESNGGTPGDWAELYNTGTLPVDVSNFLFKDNDDSRTFRIAAGQVIAPGGYLVLDEAQFGYGLGAADATRLYAADGLTLVDGYNWSAHATSTYGRCPNGAGAFAQTLSTKGAANNCSAPTDAGVFADAGSDAGVASLPWPGASTVVEVDALNAFPSNLSGLAYQAGATSASSLLWGVQNDPSKIYRLQQNGALWTSPTAGEWSAGKQIFYPTGAGRPDSEGIVLVPGEVAGTSFLYVATERDNGANTVSRLAILMFDPAAAGTTLTAQREWVLTTDLPAVGPNLGLEGIAFISDAELTAQGFREGDGQLYNQGRFAQHGGGIFLVGVEGTGAIHAYALNHEGGTFARIATFSSGMPGVMDLMYDPATNYLWAYGDDTVGNQAVLFEIEPNVASLSRGQFVQRRVFQRPSGLPNVNNEGITFAPDSECTALARAFFWADDANTGGHAVRRGSIPCGRSY